MKKIMFSFLALIATAFVTTQAMAQNGYRIQTGDILTVEVVQDPNLNREVLVLPDGSVSFPFAGTVQAAGLTTAQVQAQIATGIAPNFAVQPTVFVTVSQVGEPAFVGGVAATRTIDVFYLGEVNDPGVQELAPGTTLLQGLALGGGFTNFAATRRIQLRRTNPHTGETTMVTLDYRAVSDGGILRNDPVLAHGDVILVPERRLFE